MGGGGVPGLFLLDLINEEVDAIGLIVNRYSKVKSLNVTLRGCNRFNRFNRLHVHSKPAMRALWVYIIPTYLYL